MAKNTPEQVVLSQFPKAYAHDLFGDGKTWWICTGHPDPTCKCETPGGCPWPQTLGHSYSSARTAWYRALWFLPEKEGCALTHPELEALGNSL